MNFEHLRTFLDLVESRNFKRTADNLDLSQSTVSNRIQTLENEIGVQLLERGRSGAAPTAAGYRFATHAKQMMAAWSHALHEVGVREDHDKVLRISAQTSLESSVLVDWALALRRVSPRLALDLQSDYSVQIMRDISTGQTDVGLMFAPQMQADLKVRREGEERFLMMSSDAMSLADVDPAKYYKVDYTDGFARLHAAALPTMSSTSISVGNETVALELVSKLGGTAYLPARFVKMKVSSHLHKVADAPELTQPVYSVVHRSRRADHHVIRSLAILRDLLQ